MAHMILITISKETDPERLAAQQIWNSQLKTKDRTKKMGEPEYPAFFPTYQCKGEVGEHLYVVYDGSIFGYGVIAHIEERDKETICGGMQEVNSRWWCQITRELLEMPYHVPCIGFTGARTKDINLHECGLSTAINVIKGLGLRIPTENPRPLEFVIRKKKRPEIAKNSSPGEAGGDEFTSHPGRAR